MEIKTVVSYKKNQMARINDRTAVKGRAANNITSEQAPSNPRPVPIGRSVAERSEGYPEAEGSNTARMNTHGEGEVALSNPLPNSGPIGEVVQLDRGDHTADNSYDDHADRRAGAQTGHSNLRRALSTRPKNSNLRKEYLMSEESHTSDAVDHVAAGTAVPPPITLAKETAGPSILRRKDQEERFARKIARGLAFRGLRRQP